MRIVLCGETFPLSRDILSPLLPDDEVLRVRGTDVATAVVSADVLIPMMTRLDAALVASTSARLIQQWGAGLEGVDLEAASARGIYVCNVPSDVTPNAESTAEHAVLLMLACARRLNACFRALNEGAWGAPLGESLFGKQALIVGFGRIGKALARRLMALGMEVAAIRRSPEPDDAERAGVREVGRAADLPRLAAAADFLICTAPATAESIGMLDASTFAAMKSTAFVINVSRGSVVNESALIAALRERRLAGAGLDVYAQEPIDLRNPLLKMENVIATPHVAGVTRESYDGIARVIADNVQLVKAGQAPRHCVNLERGGFYR
jgi:phosphoglycerate dehydrogenase-like enzyme